MLEKEDIARLKEIFVTRTECDERISNTNVTIHRIDTRLTVMETYNKVIVWLLGAISSGVVALVIKQFWG